MAAYTEQKTQAALCPASDEGVGSTAINLEGFPAFPAFQTEGDMPTYNKDIDEIKQAWFGDITFCKDYQDAIKEAVASVGRATPITATASTTWVVFQVTLAAHHVTNCFEEKIIEHKETYGLDCWRFYGDLPTNLVDHDSDIVLSV